MSAAKNPFPGLRPFEYHEYELFFGREEQYEEMLAKLSDTRFLAVVGTSGSGKSSLVKAGLLPSLYGGQMLSAGPSWRVAEFRPKEDPIRELALALNHKRVFGESCKENGCSEFKLTESTNWFGLCSRVNKEADIKEQSPSSRILEVLPAAKRVELSGVSVDGDIKDRSKIVQVFNGILKQRDFYQADSFQGVPLSSDILDLLARDQKSLTDEEVGKLNRLLLEASFPAEIAKKIESQAQITEVTLRRGDLGLIEVARDAKMKSDESLLVVVDQFEELFRYAKISEHGPHGNQAAAFVKLLLAASAQKEIPIYIVLTMRSDYLGDCAKFWGLPEAINRGQYLIPRLTRDQRREAIKGPIGLRGGKITAQLVNQLLNDMGDDPDQLPILQHALMRTWDRWEKDHQNDEAIDLRHYEAIGRMAEALSLHADEAFDELPDDSGREIAEKMFQCLTERGTGRTETRRPTSLGEILAITGSEGKELVSVINVFRKEGRSFLLPAARKPLKRETLIDISHESLIRNWKRLKDWVKAEAESANVYRRLVQTARLFEQGKAGMLTDLEIEYALKWKNKNQPNLAWASRYHLDLAGVKKTSKTTNGKQLTLTDQEIFDAAMGFLAKSQEVSKRKAHNRTLTKALLVASVFLIFATAALIFQINSLQQASQIKARLVYSAEMKLTQRELEAGNFAEVNRLLHDSEDPKEQVTWLNPLTWKLPFLSSGKDTSLRGFEWHHLWKLSHDESATLREYDSNVIAITYLSKSNTVAVATRGGNIMLWDVGKGMVLANPEGGPTNPTTVAFAGDRKNVVIGRPDGSIGLWELSGDLKRMNFRQTLRDPQRALVHAIAYSPDDAFLAFATQDGVVTLLGLAENEPPHYRRLKPSQMSLAFSPDSRLLAIGHDQTVTIVDTRNKQLYPEIDLNKTIPQDINLNNAISQRSDLNKTIPQERSNQVQASPITCLAFSPDRNTLAIGRKDKSITLWDMNEKRYLISLVGHSLEVLALAFSDEAKGVLASASTDGSIKIWNAREFSKPEIRQHLNEEETAVGSQTASEKSQSLLFRTLNGHAAAVTAVVFLPNQDTVISGSEDKTVKAWSMTVKPPQANLPPATSVSVSSLAFSPNGKWVAAGNSDMSLVVWNTGDTQSSGTLLVESSSPGQSRGMPIAFSKDEVLAAATTGNTISLWQMNNPTQAPTVLSGAHTAPVLALAFSPNGKWLASGGLDRTVSLWNISKGDWSPIVNTGRDAVLSLAFSPKQPILAIGTSGKTLILWDVDQNKEIRRFEAHADAISSVAFSQDGATIATASWDRSARLWDTATGAKLLTLQGHPQRVLSVSFFPGGKRLATSCEDGNVRLWDTSYARGEKDSRNVLLTLRDSGLGAASAVATSPDGLTLATGNADGTVLLRYGATDTEIIKQSVPPR